MVNISVVFSVTAIKGSERSDKESLVSSRGRDTTYTINH